MMSRWVSVAAAVVVGAAVAGCGSGVAEGDRVACERYVGAHDAFQSRMDEVTEVTSRGEQVSPELAIAFTGAREAAHASVGDALAVAEDPVLVLALREADRVKGGLLSRDADASAAYFITEHVVSERCSEIMSPKELRPPKIGGMMVSSSQGETAPGKQARRSPT